MAVAGKAGVRRLLATGLVVAVMLGLVPALPRPSPAAAQSQPAIAPQKDPAPKPSEEIVERRTKASKTFATDTPGRFTTKVFDQAVHYPGADGRWDDIDTTLVERGQGRFHTKGSPVEVDVAPNPDDPELARVNLDARHAIGFGMRGASRGTARPDKATMAHRGIRPGTDLELTAHPQGLKEDIVLTSGQAPDTFVFPLKLKGLTAALDSATGDVTYSDEAGTERAHAAGLHDRLGQGPQQRRGRLQRRRHLPPDP